MFLGLLDPDPYQNVTDSQHSRKVALITVLKGKIRLGGGGGYCNVTKCVAAYKRIVNLQVHLYSKVMGNDDTLRSFSMFSYSLRQ
jgi:hypothetical protein